MCEFLFGVTLRKDVDAFGLYPASTFPLVSWVPLFTGHLPLMRLDAAEPWSVLVSPLAVESGDMTELQSGSRRWKKDPAPWEQWQGKLPTRWRPPLGSICTRYGHYYAGFFYAFWGKLDFIKKLKTRFFPLKLYFFHMKLDFSAILRKLYISWWILEENLSGVTLFIPLFINKIYGKRQKSTISSINRENPSKNEEICSQK